MFTIAIGGQTGGKAQGIDAGDDAFASLPELGAEMFVLDDGECTIEPRGVKGFGRGHKRDRVGGNLRAKRCRRDVSVAVKDQVAMNLVRAQYDIFRNADLGDVLDFLTVVPPAYGIVRIAEKQNFGS